MAARRPSRAALAWAGPAPSVRRYALHRVQPADVILALSFPLATFPMARLPGLHPRHQVRHRHLGYALWGRLMGLGRPAAVLQEGTLLARVSLN